MMHVIIVYCIIMGMLYYTKFKYGNSYPHIPASLPSTTLFFVRTKFIRTPSLRFGQMLRTFWTLKSPSFLIVLKVKYWGSKPPFLPNNVFFCWLSIANFGQNDRKHSNYGYFKQKWTYFLLLSWKFYPKN